jgi:hypothetical protein
MEAQKREKKSCFVELGSAKLVFEPGKRLETSVKKHPCADCHFCQFCSDSRCSACQCERKRPGGSLSRELSLCEQIRLHDKLDEETS